MAGVANEIIRVLMGEKVEPRREFIEKPPWARGIWTCRCVTWCSTNNLSFSTNFLAKIYKFVVTETPVEVRTPIPRDLGGHRERGERAMGCGNIYGEELRAIRKPR